MRLTATRYYAKGYYVRSRKLARKMPLRSTLRCLLARLYFARIINRKGA